MGSGIFVVTKGREEMLQGLYITQHEKYQHGMWGISSAFAPVPGREKTREVFIEFAGHCTLLTQADPQPEG
jgi:hypothetical protein